MSCRYSDDTIQAMEMLDSDEKIDLQLIVSLIRHVVLNEGVSSTTRGSSLCGKYIKMGFQRNLKHYL